MCESKDCSFFIKNRFFQGCRKRCIHALSGSPFLYRGNICFDSNKIVLNFVTALDSSVKTYQIQTADTNNGINNTRKP